MYYICVKQTTLKRFTKKPSIISENASLFQNFCILGCTNT